MQIQGDTPCENLPNLSTIMDINMLSEAAMGLASFTCIHAAHPRSSTDIVLIVAGVYTLLIDFIAPPPLPISSL